MQEAFGLLVAALKMQIGRPLKRWRLQGKNVISANRFSGIHYRAQSYFTAMGSIILNA